MTDKKICCVILNYNDIETTLNLIKVVDAYQSLNYIIVVDNCSTDNSLPKLKSFESERIRVIKSEYNGGYGYGNNIGIKYAKEKLGCKYALITNPDVEYEETIVDILISCMDKSEIIALAAPVQMDTNHKVIRDLAWKIPSIYQYIFTAEILINKFFRGFYYPKNTFNKLGLYEVECLPGSLLMIDVDVFLDVGGYDEEMFLYCEETTLGYKLKEYGYKSILLTNCSYVHHHSISIRRTINCLREQRKILLQSRMIFLKKYLKVNKYQSFLAKMVFSFADLEQIIIQKIRNCLTGISQAN